MSDLVERAAMQIAWYRSAVQEGETPESIWQDISHRDRDQCLDDARAVVNMVLDEAAGSIEQVEKRLLDAVARYEGNVVKCIELDMDSADLLHKEISIARLCFDAIRALGGER